MKVPVWLTIIIAGVIAILIGLLASSCSQLVLAETGDSGVGTIYEIRLSQTGEATITIVPTTTDQKPWQYSTTDYQIRITGKPKEGGILVNYSEYIYHPLEEGLTDLVGKTGYFWTYREGSQWYLDMDVSTHYQVQDQERGK